MKKISDTKPRSFSYVIVDTDVETVKAVKNLDFAKLNLLPKDCWQLRNLIIASRKRK
jgi:hypothetical protein